MNYYDNSNGQVAFRQRYQQQQEDQYEENNYIYPDGAPAQDNPFGNGYDGTQYEYDGYGEDQNGPVSQPFEDSYSPAAGGYYHASGPYDEDYPLQPGPYQEAPQYLPPSLSQPDEIGTNSNQYFNAGPENNDGDVGRQFYDEGYPVPALPMGYAASPALVPAIPSPVRYGHVPRTSTSSGSSHRLVTAAAGIDNNMAVSSSANIPRSPPPPTGRTLLKDRYNPNGPVEKMFAVKAAGYDGNKGRKRRCSPRRCCCAVVVIILLLAGVIAACFFLLYKQPDVRFLSVESPANGLPRFSTDQLNFSMNFQLRVSVKNPNILGITFNTVVGEARFKGVSPNVVGSGRLENLSVPSNSDQIILFPFAINYDPANDPGSRILLYVAKSCGLLGNTKEKLVVDYTIVFGISFLSSLGINPAFTSTTSFDCPLDGSQTLPNLSFLS